MSSILRPLKPQKPRSLEGQLSFVPFHQQAVLIPGQPEFHAVSAFYLEGGVIGGEAVVLRGVISVVVIHIGALGDHRCRDGESGGIVVFCPLAQASDSRYDDDNGYRHEGDGKQDVE